MSDPVSLIISGTGLTFVIVEKLGPPAKRKLESMLRPHQADANLGQQARAKKQIDTRGYALSQATRTEIGWVARLQETYFKQDAVPLQKLLDWHTVNPTGFLILKQNGTPIGHVDLLPVKPEPMAYLREGAIKETDLTGSDLYGEAERDLIQSLYLESGIICDRPRGTQAAGSIFLFLRLGEIVGRLCEPSRLERLYAMAATGAGKNVLRRLGFKAEGEAAHREDHHGFFGMDYATLQSKVDVYIARHASAPPVDTPRTLSPLSEGGALGGCALPE